MYNDKIKSPLEGGAGGCNGRFRIRLFLFSIQITVAVLLLTSIPLTAGVFVRNIFEKLKILPRSLSRSQV
jgi:hypothetical protein